MKFKLNGGCHRDANGKIYKKGDIIETDSDLSTLCGGKFIRIFAEQENEEVEQPKIKNPKKGKAKDKKSSSSSKKDDDGEKDVTADFPTAKENGYQVIKNGKQYNVIDIDDGTTANETPLKKKEVQDFIESQLADDDEDEDDEE